MLAKLRARAAEESGFTLVELLVVIAILGVLAGVVVFSVAGITDNSATAACDAEKSTLRSAEEAYYVKNKTYTDAAGLQAARLIGSAPSKATVTVSGSGSTATYTVGGC